MGAGKGKTAGVVVRAGKTRASKTKVKQTPKTKPAKKAAVKAKRRG